MANFFKKLFGYRDKQDTTFTGTRPSGIGDFPSYQDARSLLGSIGSPESYAGIYEKELFQPYRAQALRELHKTMLPTTRAAFSGRGLGFSSPAARAESDIATDLGLNLALQRGQFRTQGLDRGFSQQGRKLAGLQNLLGAERAQQAAMTAFDERDYARQREIAEARRAANQAAIGRAVEFGGGILGVPTAGFGGGSSNALAELLGLNKGGGQNPFMSGFLDSIKKAFGLGRTATPSGAIGALGLPLN